MEEDYETTKCIVCLKLATCHTGHVLLDGHEVLAGWCDEHKVIAHDIPNMANSLGCKGGWIREYGLRRSE